jgi:prevent-host-death family protein
MSYKAMMVRYHMLIVKTITPLDLRRSLGSILDQASAGQRFLIERDRRPLAVLVSIEDAARLDEPGEQARARRAAAIAALEEYSHRVGRPRDAGAAAAAADLIRADRDDRDVRDHERGAGG